MTDKAREELETLACVPGIFAGQCDEAGLDELVRDGYAERYYEGAAGLMGLAKVRLTEKGERAAA